MAGIRPLSCLLIITSTIFLLNAIGSVESRSHRASHNLVRRSLEPTFSNENKDYESDQGYGNNENVLNDGEDNSEDDSEEDEDDLEPTVENREPSQITSSSKNITVHLGETVYLPCNVVNLGVTSFLWVKGNDVTLYMTRLKGGGGDRINLFENNTISIKNFKKSDIGMYTCKLLNKEQSNVTYYVDIFTPPKIEKMLPDEKSRTIIENSELVLECRASGNPKPTIKWSLEGYRVEEDADLKFHDQSIIIKHAKRKHGGTYQCLAENGDKILGHGNALIRILYKPKIHIKKSVVNTDEGYEGVLFCSVQSDPRSSIIWMKDNQIIDGSNMAHKYRVIHSPTDNHSTLKIMDVKAEDFGTYVCNATNSIGRAIGHVNLVKQPGRALWIGGSQTSDESGPMLKWTVDSVQPLTNVEIKYFKMDETKPDQVEGEWIIDHPRFENPTGGKYTITHVIEGLKPGKYAAHLRAQNAHGWGEMSEKHTFDGDYLSNEIRAEAIPEAAVSEIASGALTVRMSTASVLVSSLLSYCLMRIL